MTPVHGGRAERDVAELEHIYSLEKPVPGFRARAHNLLLAFLACVAIMILSGMFIMEASR